MSLILDALRRRPRSHERTTEPGRADRSDAVLETLGYSSDRSRFTSALPYGLAVAVLVLATWGIYVWYPIAARPVIDPSRSARLPTPAPSVPSSSKSSQIPSTAAPDSQPVETTPTSPAPATSLPALPSTSQDPGGPPRRANAAPTGSTEIARASRARPRSSSEVDVLRAIPPSESASDSSGARNSKPQDNRPALSRPTATEPTPPVAVATPPPPVAIRSARADELAGEPAHPPLSPAAGALRPSATAIVSGSQTDHFRLALYYHRTGDFESALMHYRALLAQNELNAEARNNLGLLYQEKGLIDEAVKEFQRAISIDQRYVKAHNNLGVVWLRVGKVDAAAAEFRAALAADARNVESLTNLAVVKLQAGHLDEARELLQRALALEPRHAATHYNMGLIFEKRGDLEGAIGHYRKFIDNITPDQAPLAVETRQRLVGLQQKLGK